MDHVIDPHDFLLASKYDSPIFRELLYLTPRKHSFFQFREEGALQVEILAQGPG
jgi:hypothetical protein